MKFLVTSTKYKALLCLDPKRGIEEKDLIRNSLCVFHGDRVLVPFIYFTFYDFVSMGRMWNSFTVSV